MISDDIMAYSFQPLEQALDSLGFSYIDGVNVKIASKYQVDCDLSQVKSILAKPAPSVLAFDSHYDTTYEKQVLADLEARAEAEKSKTEARKKRIEEYERKKQEKLEQKKKEEEEKALEDERKRLQEIEDEKKARLEAEQKLIEEERRVLEEEAIRKKQEEEAEWKKFEEERCRKDSESCDRSEEEFKTPPQEPKTPDEAIKGAPSNTHAETKVTGSHQGMKEQLPAAASEIVVKGTQSHQHKFNNINFSDFEATSDPFADLELKSINDLAELQTILGRVSTANTSTASQPPHTGQVYTAGKVIMSSCDCAQCSRFVFLRSEQQRVPRAPAAAAGGLHELPAPEPGPGQPPGPAQPAAAGVQQLRVQLPAAAARHPAVLPPHHLQPGPGAVLPPPLQLPARTLPRLLQSAARHLTVTATSIYSSQPGHRGLASRRGGARRPQRVLGPGPRPAAADQGEAEGWRGRGGGGGGQRGLGRAEAREERGRHDHRAAEGGRRARGPQAEVPGLAADLARRHGAGELDPVASAGPGPASCERSRRGGLC